MFVRFTDSARAAVQEAQAEAAMLNHDLVGTEHLLLGLLADTGSVAGRVLARQGLTRGAARVAVVRTIGPCQATGTADGDDAEALATIGIDLGAVRSAVEASFGGGALERAPARRGRRRPAPLTPRAKKVLDLALREALTLRHSYIGTEHQLLALVGLGKGVAFEVLDELVPPAPRLRERVLDELDRRMRPGA